MDNIDSLFLLVYKISNKNISAEKYTDISMRGCNLGQKTEVRENMKVFRWFKELSLQDSET